MATISNTPDAPISMASQPANPSISAEDLQNLLQIIDLATQRGAFKATELSQIGSVFDRVVVFLKAISDQQQKQAAQTPVADPSAPVPMNIPAQPTGNPIPTFLNNKGTN